MTTWLTQEGNEGPSTNARQARSQGVEARGSRGEAGKYLYAIIPIDEEKSFGNFGIGGGEVYTIICRDVACVVSDTVVSEYELTEDNLRGHDQVLRRLLESYSVLPAEFGSVFQNEKILEHLVKKAYSPIRDGLKLVDDAAELGVKVVLRKKPEDAGVEEGTEIIVEILGSLRKIAMKSVSEDLFSDRLILNESFLVKKGNVVSFSEEVSRLELKYPSLRFLYSGPWAPHNFIHIKIGREGIVFGKGG